MTPFQLLVPLALAFLLASPAAATLVLSRTTLVPPSLPLVPGQDLSADAVISIIPSGARTFSSGHSLQIETDLQDATWSTAVFVDGIPADRQQGEGRVMFINGFILSYPTNKDVSLEVTARGLVPGGMNPVTVLTIRELDNSGLPVAGSTVTLTGPVSAPTASATTGSPSPTGTPPPPPSPTSPAGAEGWTWPVALIAVGGAVFACRHAGRKGP